MIGGAFEFALIEIDNLNVKYLNFPGGDFIPVGLSKYGEFIFHNYHGIWGLDLNSYKIRSITPSFSRSINRVLICDSILVVIFKGEWFCHI